MAPLFCLCPSPFSVNGLSLRDSPKVNTHAKRRRRTKAQNAAEKRDNPTDRGDVRGIRAFITRAIQFSAHDKRSALCFNSLASVDLVERGREGDDTNPVQPAKHARHDGQRRTERQAEDESGGLGTSGHPLREEGAGQKWSKRLALAPAVVRQRGW